MRNWKRMLTVVMALAMLASLALPALAAGNGYTQITAGQTLTPDENDEKCLLKFVPETDGWYAFWSDSVHMDPSARLWNDDVDFSNDDSGDDPDFMIKAQLTAGETYYLRAVWDWDPGISITLHLDPMVPATGITLETQKLSGYSGDYFYPDYAFEPMLAIPEEVTWKSSNKDLVTVDEYGYVRLENPGTATVTATSASGLTASVEVTVLEVRELTEGDCVFLTGEQDTVRFRFIPETTGSYCFYSTDAQTVTDGFVMDEYGDWLNANCGGLDGKNFLMRVYLLAGHPYDLEVDPCGGSLNVHLEKAVAAQALELSEEQLEGLPGDEYYLDYTFAPVNSLFEGITWSSSDETVATVTDYGMVTLIGPGTATVTATSESGLTDTVAVNVIQVAQYSTVAGYVISYDEYDTTVELLDGENVLACLTVPGSNGTYELTDIPFGTYTIRAGKENHAPRTDIINVSDVTVLHDIWLCLLGDVTGDGRINVADTSMVYAHARETARITDEYILACADVTGDGKINVADTSKIYAQARK